MYGKTDDTQDRLEVTIGLGGYGSTNTGIAWFDDIKVENLDSLPVGKTAISLFTEKQEDSSKTSKYSNLKYIIITLLVIFVIGAIISLFKNNKSANSNKENKTSYVKSTGALNIKETDEGILKKTKYTRNDFIVMLIMTFIYLIIALFNLGSRNFPQTSWTPTFPGESFIADLGKEVTLSRLYFNNGLGIGRECTGKYRVEYLNGQGNYLPLCSYEKKDIFVWKFVDVEAVKTRGLKFIVDVPNGALNEVGVFELGSIKPLNNIKIVQTDINPKDLGTPKNLFDEPQTVVYNPTYLDGMYFDEIYHARTAYEFLHRIEPFENTHPPLGKLFISLGILAFGMVPFGWRIVGTLFGVAMVPLMYMFGKKLFGKSFYAILAAFLTMFDFMHFTQSRIATIDVYVTFFIILMYYFMFDYIKRKSYMLDFKDSIKPLLFCGIAFGLGAASKWIAIYGVAGLAILFISVKYFEYKDYVQIRLKDTKKKSVNPDWYSLFITVYMKRTAIYCCLFFIAIPLTIYILSFIPYMAVPGPDHGIDLFYRNSINMYNYHKNLVATHPFQSAWWEWPIMSRPIAYYAGTNPFTGNVSNITAFGNPAIWWVGIPAFFVSLYFLIKKKKDRKILFLLIAAVFFQYVPWIIIPRIAFIYHYFSIVPFMVLLIVYLIKELIEKYSKSKHYIYSYLGIVVGLFIMFYPVLSGYEVNPEYMKYLRWFKHWYF